MKSYGVSAYDEKTGKGCVRHILIRYGEKTGEWMVCFVINGKKLPHAESFIEVLKDLPGMTSITVNINESRGNVILGEETYTLYGKGYITDYIGTISFQISPQSFYQVNPAQTEVLYNKALEYANLTGEETVWEPFPYFWHRKRRRFTVWKLYRRQSQMPKRMPFEITFPMQNFSLGKQRKSIRHTVPPMAKKPVQKLS